MLFCVCFLYPSYLTSISSVYVSVEASMHVHWDKYANIVFTPAWESLTDMLAALVQSNEEWQRLLDQTGLERRPLDVCRRDDLALC